MLCSEHSRESLHSRGFTLLELLTVLLLMGFLLGVGLRLDIGMSRNTPDEQLAQLAQQFTLASLEAVQAGAVWGLDFYQQPGQSGYRWLMYDGQRWRDADPVALEGDDNTFSWPDDSVAELMVDGVAVTPTPLGLLEDDTVSKFLIPEILLLPTRENTPFLLQLRQSGQQVTLSVDALGRTALESVDAAQ